MKVFFDTPVLLRQVASDAPLKGFEEADVITGILNAFELVHTILRQKTDRAAVQAFDRVSPLVQPLTRSRIFEASRVRIRHRDRGLSYADASGYVTARELSALFVTTDRGFRGLRGVEVVPA